VEHRRVDLDDVIYGVHAVTEAMAAGEPLRKLHIGEERKRDAAVRQIIARALERSVPVRFENRRFFSRFPYKAHQSVIGFAAPFEYAALSDVLQRRPAGSSALIVVLDHITDPRNAGAIIRTAECAGASGLILPERRAAGVNPTVRKTAAGAVGHLPIARVVNLADALRKLKKAGVWIAGADAGPGSVPLLEADFRSDVAIVIGAEGKGLSDGVRRECDFTVRIPLMGRVASLNASVAAGVILYEALRQRSC